MRDIINAICVFKMIEELSVGMCCGVVSLSDICCDEPDCGRIVYDDTNGVLIRDDDIFEYPIIWRCAGTSAVTYDSCCDGVTVRLVRVPVAFTSDVYSYIVLRFDGCEEYVEISDGGQWEVIREKDVADDER